MVLSWAQGSRRRGRHIGRTLRHIVVFVVIVAALYLLLPRVVDTRQTLRLLGDASYVLLGAAAALEVLALLGYANLTRYILRVLDVRLRLREVLAITLGSLAVSHVLSAGGVGGWVVTYNALRRRRVPHGLVFVAIAAQQFFNYAVLWLLFAVALVYLVVERGESPLAYTAALVLIGLLLWLSGYGVYLYNHRTKMRRRVGQLARLVNRVMRRDVVREEHVDGWLDNLFAGMRRMTGRRGAFRTTLALACAYWLFDMLCLWATFLAFHHGVSFSALVVAYVVAYSVGTLAPTPGGLGAVEGILIALCVSFGVPSATAVAVVLVYRLINFWLPIPPGFVAYTLVRPGRETAVAAGGLHGGGSVGAAPTVAAAADRAAAPDHGAGGGAMAPAAARDPEAGTESRQDGGSSSGDRPVAELEPGGAPVSGDGASREGSGRS